MKLDASRQCEPKVSETDGLSHMLKKTIVINYDVMPPTRICNCLSMRSKSSKRNKSCARMGQCCKSVDINDADVGFGL